MRALKIGLNGFLVFVMVLAAFPPQISKSTSPSTAAPAASSLAMQFTAGGHVLGFRADGIYVASANHALHLQFVGANAVEPVSGQAAAAGRQVQPLQSVSWQDLWPGISLTYAASPAGIVESTYQVAAGASLERIELAYNAPAHLDESGDLVLAYSSGEMTESAPQAWQQVNGQQQRVEVSYRILESSDLGSRVGFSARGVDPTQDLTIDPKMQWMGYLGGTSDEDISDITLDSSGNVYLTGDSSRSWGDPVHEFGGGNQDAFVAKLNSSGALLWNTFLGGTSYDYSYAIAVDSGGNIYITGLSHVPWGTPVGSFTGATFVARLASNGALTWHTFLGSSINDCGYDLLVSGTTLYVTGETYAAWGNPVQNYSGLSDVFVAALTALNGTLIWNTNLGSTDRDYGGGIALGDSSHLDISGSSRAGWGGGIGSFVGSGTGTQNGFLAQLNTSTGGMVWNTFFGGGDGGSWRVTTDSAGAIYVNGYAGVSWGNPVRAHSGTDNGDIGVAKFASNGELVWNTFLGGQMGGFAGGIVIDGSNHLYVNGWTIDTWGTPIQAGEEAFVAKLNAATGSLTWNTFQGKDATNTWIQNTALAIDLSGNLFSGGTGYSSFGTPVNDYSGGDDAMAFKMDSSGAVIWNTFEGDSDDDFTAGVTVDSSGNVYVIGNSTQTWESPVQDFSGGASDVFVAKISPLGTPTWTTFVGGAGNDYGRSIAVDDTLGIIFITGYSGSTWGSHPVRNYTAGSDTFVAELAASGSLLWNTFLGGSGSDFGASISEDPNSGLYVAGTSSAAWGGADVSRPFTSDNDGFAAKLNLSGILQWVSFLGGSGSDHALAGVVHGNYYYVAGYSSASWCSPSCYRSYTGGDDGFVAKINLAGGTLEWDTFLGGTGDDSATAITADPSGWVYAAGTSDAAWGASPKRAYTGGTDAFVAKINTLGGMAMQTFLGGNGTDSASGIAADKYGWLYVTGNSKTAWGSPTRPYFKKQDGFLVQLDAAGLIQSTNFLGAEGDDTTTAVALDSGKNAIVVGSSNEGWYYDMGGKMATESVNTHLANYSGGWDGYVIKLSYTELFLPAVRK